MRVASEGRVAKRLRELLDARGFRSVELGAVLGRDRPDGRADVMRGVGRAYWGGHAMPFNLGSWDTMTECVKNGIEVRRDDGAFFDFSSK